MPTPPDTPSLGPDESLRRRRRMIQEQIRARDVHDPDVLRVMEDIPREHFLPPELSSQAYADCALGVGERQTISQPYIVAYMTARACVTPACRVLEIGTGTGYQTAILARLARHVYSVERLARLHEGAAGALARLGVANVTLRCADGSVGWAEYAPFDRIVVTAGAPVVPRSLTRQLTEGGILIAPVGPVTAQRIARVERRGARTIETPLLPCRFVRLIGKEGFSGDTEGA